MKSNFSILMTMGAFLFNSACNQASHDGDLKSDYDEMALNQAWTPERIEASRYLGDPVGYAVSKAKVEGISLLGINPLEYRLSVRNVESDQMELALAPHVSFNISSLMDQFRDPGFKVSWAANPVWTFDGVTRRLETTSLTFPTLDGCLQGNFPDGESAVGSISGLAPTCAYGRAVTVVFKAIYENQNVLESKLRLVVWGESVEEAAHNFLANSISAIILRDQSDNSFGAMMRPNNYIANAWTPTHLRIQVGHVYDVAISNLYSSHVDEGAIEPLTSCMSGLAKVLNAHYRSGPELPTVGQNPSLMFANNWDTTTCNAETTERLRINSGYGAIWYPFDFY